MIESVAAETGPVGIVLLVLAAAGGLLVGRAISRLITRRSGARDGSVTGGGSAEKGGAARERDGRSPAGTQRRGGKKRQAKRRG